MASVRSVLCAQAHVQPRVPITKVDLAKYIDHTCLVPTATVPDIDRVCDEAVRHNFWSVCIGPSYVKHAAKRLRGSGVKVCSVVGFPLGFTFGRVKLAEAEEEIGAGADEIDMVMNISAFKSEDYTTVSREIEEVAEFCHSCGRLLKVIVECCYLTDEEKVRAAQLAERAGADFVKTSTGLGPSGATSKDVSLLKRALTGTTRVKAAGGIRTLDDVLGMIIAGADRIGTSSGAKIMAQWDERTTQANPS
jgi:deoxyribose-phosphate aldolase